MNRYLIPILMLPLSFQVGALGSVIGYDEIPKSYFGAIQSITTCGSYATEHQFGEYRLIQSYISGGSMLFIDKIQYDQSTLQVVRGFTFAEINNDHIELNIEQTSCKTEPENTVLLFGKVKGSGHDEELKYDFTIRLNTDNGSYQYKEHF